jgi:hypothetical protein
MMGSRSAVRAGISVESAELPAQLGLQRVQALGLVEASVGDRPGCLLREQGSGLQIVDRVAAVGARVDIQHPEELVSTHQGHAEHS